MSNLRKILILGGGFGGIYTAIELEKRLKSRGDVEITLVSKENFQVFTPMLHEVAASELGATNAVNPISKLLKKTNFFCGSVDRIDLDSRTVDVSHGDLSHPHTLEYDHLVLALGAVTNFRGLPTNTEGLLGMKSLGDAIYLRNRMIALMEEANFECCKDLRESLLTFVVAGGGFAGVETVAAIIDFLHDTLPFYPNLKKDDLRVVLANSGKIILPELSASLGKYAGKELEKRGVKIFYESKVSSYHAGEVTFSAGNKLKCCTLVWTAGNTCNPLLDTINCAKEKGRVLVSEKLSSSTHFGLWALGDCAAVPNGKGGFHPPTAQHAIRQAKVLAHNIISALNGSSMKKFKFKTLGQLASLGRRKGVAEVLGIRFSGIVAWWLWRSIYLMKLPRFERRVRVALDWTLDIVFSKDTVQIPTGRSSNVEVKRPSIQLNGKAAKIPEMQPEALIN